MHLSKSQSIQNILLRMPALASSKASVLITGESGTGKELLAQMIHNSGPRAHEKFICVNCAAIPENLLESELFGHKKGSFTGAVSDHIGLFEEAEGGTIFLDEIGDMPLPLQAKILRVLQEKKIKPIGSNIEKPVGFRLISATHKDLKTEIVQGRFREDLYYRIGVIHVHLPALRQRKEDIPLLIDKFLNLFSEKYKFPFLKMTDEAMADLSQRPWPGNIRELENLVENLVVLNQETKTIDLEDLPNDQVLDSDHEENSDYLFKKFKHLPTVEELTNQYIDYVIKHVNRHQGEASNILGISRRTLYRRRIAQN